METTSWNCDSCGQPIQEADHGWVEWIEFATGSPKHGTGRDLRLVHHVPHSPSGASQINQKCEYAADEGLVHDVSLTSVQGPNGLMLLLTLLSDGVLPKEEVLEMIKRVRIPGYENARLYFSAAISAGVFEPNTKARYYFDHQIEATNEWAESQED